ncbi:TPA: phenylalanine--tRNA ligase subunit beta [Candidatus Poribacteria bacterium]|nr:phenylalanine--tRNA ligase subunit beta [Candidatus Poribacteria bacterium]
MKVSVKWLKEFVEFDHSAEELAHLLTMSGVEVSKIERLDSGLDKVVVGKIVNLRPHPKADKLVLCDVDVGGKTVQIICGAPNAREGLIAPVALVGARLPAGMEIKPVRLRGEYSHGMLCSEKELGFSEDASGLMELPTNLEVGTPLPQALGVDDVVFELDLTPNRPDCLSIFGVAREVSAILGNPLRLPEISMSESDTEASSVTSVKISDPDLCPRYAARIIRGVKIAPSPTWLQQRLEAIGLHGINNVVDVTNYVLMELGHPLHAFDYHKLAENRIIVRRAFVGEEIVTIDEESRSLTDDMLVIADAEKAVALAGVMGGFDSEVTENTTDVLLESAYFNPISIRKTSRALGMHTEASHRFERGTDIEGLITSLNRAAQLIQEIAGGEICKGIVDAYPVKFKPVKIHLRPERVNFLLGTNIKRAEMKDILTRLKFEVSDDTCGEGVLEVTAPTFQPEIVREVDLIEEIARIWGYDNIPTVLPTGDIPLVKEDIKIALRERTKSVMLGCGLTEAVNPSFYSPRAFDAINLPEDSPYRKALVLQKPLSEEQSIMRTTLIPSLLGNVQWNVNHQVPDVKLFELARIFNPKESELPDEREMLAGVISGSMSSGLWNDKTREVDFFDIKGIVENLFEEFGLVEYEVKPVDHPTLHPNKSAQIRMDGEILGIMGEVHPNVLDNYDISQKVYLFELDFDKLAEYYSNLLRESPDVAKHFQPLSQFPSVFRDLAIVLPEDVPSEEAKRIIQKTGGEIIASLKLFDVYTGQPVPEGKKSLAYSIEYNSKSGTLTEDSVDVIHQKIISQLAKNLNAELRS